MPDITLNLLDPAHSAKLLPNPDAVDGLLSLYGDSGLDIAADRLLPSVMPESVQLHDTADDADLEELGALMELDRPDRWDGRDYNE